MFEEHPERISSTLICSMYAISLVYWQNSSELTGTRRPNMDFAWNQANAALEDDFVAPYMTTIQAALLGMGGRPVAQIQHNIANAGRVVTCAHSIGLHRDPTAWNATETEKDLRLRLWWSVLIHDYW